MDDKTIEEILNLLKTDSGKKEFLEKLHDSDLTIARPKLALEYANLGGEVEWINHEIHKALKTNDLSNLELLRESFIDTTIKDKDIFTVYPEHNIFKPIVENLVSIIGWKNTNLAERSIEQLVENKYYELAHDLAHCLSFSKDYRELELPPEDSIFKLRGLSAEIFAKTFSDEYIKFEDYGAAIDTNMFFYNIHDALSIAIKNDITRINDIAEKGFNTFDVHKCVDTLYLYGRI